MHLQRLNLICTFNEFTLNEQDMCSGHASIMQFAFKAEKVL